jgi:hypothetical protein
LDIHELGELSEDEKEDDGDMNLMKVLTKSGVDNEDEEELSSLTIADRMFASLDDDDKREKERRVILDREQNIAAFNIEPEAETC